MRESFFLFVFSLGCFSGNAPSFFRIPGKVPEMEKWLQQQQIIWLSPLCTINQTFLSILTHLLSLQPLQGPVIINEMHCDAQVVIVVH